MKLLQFFPNLLRRVPDGTFLTMPYRFIIWLVLGFAWFGSFMHSVSYSADVSNTNALFTVLGILLLLIWLNLASVAFSENKK
jgi:hypothetical protein